MKRLISLLRGVLKNDRRLVAGCYLAFFLVSLFFAFYGFAEDRIQRALGNVVTTEISADDFDWVDFEQQEDGSYLTLSPDPRMVLRQVPEYIRSVRIEAEFLNMDPGEFCIFYKPDPGMEDYDANYRVWAYIEPDGSYFFQLPRGKVYGFRLDPGIYTGIEMKITSITLNPQQSFLSWFVPSRVWLLAQLVIPAMIAGAIKCAQIAFGGLWPRKRLEDGGR